MSAPASASASAIAWPIPLEAPVTTAQRPVRSKRVEAGIADVDVTLRAVRLGVAAAVVDGALVRGDVDVEDGRIAAVGLAGGGSGIAVPGLVDLQVNGYRGIDVLQATSDELATLGARAGPHGRALVPADARHGTPRADAARARDDRAPRRAGRARGSSAPTWRGRS